MYTAGNYPSTEITRPHQINTDIVSQRKILENYKINKKQGFLNCSALFWLENIF